MEQMDIIQRKQEQLQQWYSSITGYVKNSAGKTATCSATIYYDKTAPTCTWNKANTTWIKSYSPIRG